MVFETAKVGVLGYIDVSMKMGIEMVLSDYVEMTLDSEFLVDHPSSGDLTC